MAVLQSTRVAMNDDGERARCSFGDFGDLVTTVAKIMADRHSGPTSGKPSRASER
jgi:hypothetical protein